MNSLVTGGLQGIGRAIVEILHARGDAVFVFDIPDPSDQRVASLREKGISYFSVNVADVQSVANCFVRIIEVLKGQPLDVLVNNAGIARDNLVMRMSEEDWDAVCDVNLKGAFLCTQQALKKMIRQKKSYIINMSSIVGVHGNAGQANYAASKAGLIALTKSLAQEYGKRNILVNAIAPGFIATSMTDSLAEQNKQAALQRIALKRFGMPDDVAKLVAFLTSGDADYITGQVIEISGGMA